MCTTCGCGGSHTHTHVDEHGNVVTHTHGPHDHDHTHEHHDHDHAHEHSHAASRTVTVEEDILARNNREAEKLREEFRRHKILALNFVSSPGSGKTELLSATVRARKEGDPVMNVIEGDLQTDNDASRIREAGARAVQINTGKGCHLDAEQVTLAVKSLSPQDNSVTEGEDKPLKYPDMFAAADLMIINKIDLAPYVKFDLDKCEENARRVNPRIQSLRVSATTGEGLEKWLAWLKAQYTLATL